MFDSCNKIVGISGPRTQNPFDLLKDEKKPPPKPFAVRSARSTVLDLKVEKDVIVEPQKRAIAVPIQRDNETKKEQERDSQLPIKPSQPQAFAQRAAPLKAQPPEPRTIPGMSNPIPNNPTGKRQPPAPIKTADPREPEKEKPPSNLPPQKREEPPKEPVLTLNWAQKIANEQPKAPVHVKVKQAALPLNPPDPRTTPPKVSTETSVWGKEPVSQPKKPDQPVSLPAKKEAPQPKPTALPKVSSKNKAGSEQPNVVPRVDESQFPGIQTNPELAPPSQNEAHKPELTTKSVARAKKGAVQRPNTGWESPSETTVESVSQPKDEPVPIPSKREAPQLALSPIANPQREASPVTEPVKLTQQQQSQAAKALLQKLFQLSNEGKYPANARIDKLESEIRECVPPELRSNPEEPTLLRDSHSIRREKLRAIGSESLNGSGTNPIIEPYRIHGEVVRTTRATKAVPMIGPEVLSHGFRPLVSTKSLHCSLSL